MTSSIELLSIALPETFTVRISPKLLAKVTDESVFIPDSRGLAIMAEKKDGPDAKAGC